MNITYQQFESGDITFLKGLCDALMQFQGEQAKIKPEVMRSMNFENRLVPDFANAKRKHMVVAYDEDRPIGFAFGSVSTLGEEDLRAKPPWANDLGGLGFYPLNYSVPKTIGTFKLLFVDPAYRGKDIGLTLSEQLMEWLNSHEDVEDLWVFVANGNEIVGKFYEKLGFTYSHKVFGGFIEAYYQPLKK